MIGIVGGVGPLAGAEMFKYVVEQTEARSDQDHLPVLLWSVPQHIPDRTEFLEGRVQKNPGTPIAEILLDMEKTGVNLAAIACNTAHASVIYQEILNRLKSADSKIRLLNMVAEIVNHVRQNFPQGTSVGILSTTGVWKHEIYAAPLRKEGFQVVVPLTVEEQNKIHQAIYDKDYGIKAGGTHISKKATAVVQQAAENLIDQGAEVLILGCTELPLALPFPSFKKVPVLNSMKVLARSLIRVYAPEKLKNQEKDTL